ncbi:MAG: SAM-dependent methyltransferase [Gammaproteobacteria bacterium]|nr:SAM-dependent methyltransferase [Gammaproteobacteria bacterium]
MPIPSDSEKQRSRRCQQIIVDEIKHNQQPISFQRYMQLCLYTEEVGYYESNSDIFGSKGDFTTSPENGNFFAVAFAAHINKIKQQLNTFSVIEVGAGSGKFAADLIQAMKQNDCLPQCYYIVEKSAALRRRQKQYLASAQSDCNIVWIENLDEPIECGVVIANEVLDALPVTLVSVLKNSVSERCVALDEKGDLRFVDIPAIEYLSNLIGERLPSSVLNKSGSPYQCDINLLLDDFIQQITSFVKQGIFFYIDYGYARHEYYHEQRSMGTLICHYQHVANEQPLLWPGLQDISCNVDFTALAEAGTHCDLQVNSYSTQAHFLLASDALEKYLTEDKYVNVIERKAEIKRLMMPAEMGERFQAMVLTKNIDFKSNQFTTKNMLHRL